MKTNTFIGNQAVSPVELLARLSHLKTSSEISSHKLKEIKQLEDNLSFYERYCLTTIENLQHKLQSITIQVNEVKKAYKNVEELGVEKFDKVEKLLEQTLNNYEMDRKKGEFMIKELVDSIQEKLEKSIVEKSMKSSQLIEQYLNLNMRLESIAESLDSMESKLLGKYQRLRSDLNEKFTNFMGLISSQIEETQRHTETLIRKLEQIEKDCEVQIEKINEKKQKKRYQMHEMVQKMIEETIQSTYSY